SRMRQGHAEIGESELARPFGGAAVQDQHRLSAAIRQHFHLPPPNADNTGAKCLGCGFLGREPRGKLVYAIPIPFPLAFGVDTLQETLTEIIERTLDTRNLNDIDANSNLAFALGVKLGDVPPLPFPLLDLRYLVILPAVASGHQR